MGTTANAKALFMKYAEGFGLPSVSPGCIQVEVPALPNTSFSLANAARSRAVCSQS